MPVCSPALLRASLREGQDMKLPGESRHITINGVRVHYVEAGQGSPVVLLHGLGASVVTWRENIGPLAEHHRVYAVDLPGHGDSEKPDDLSYSLSSMINFTKSLVEALGHERAAFAGSSIGGGLALMTAVNHPEVVSKLMLSSSAALGREVALFLRLASLPFLGELMTSGVRDPVRAWLRKSFYDKSLASGDLLDELRRTNSLTGAGEAGLKIARVYIGLWGVRRRYVLTRRLKRLDVPTLIFWGADDEIIPVKHAYRAAKELPKSDLHVFGNCGHWSHVERASEFNRLSLEFLSR